ATRIDIRHKTEASCQRPIVSIKHGLPKMSGIAMEVTAFSILLIHPLLQAPHVFLGFRAKALPCF
ncbi:MAG: hypothetical protein WBD95_19540, partial [Xanthobacteraceae bacterium]